MPIPSAGPALSELKELCKQNPESQYFYVTHVERGKIALHLAEPKEKINIPEQWEQPLQTLPVGESFRWKVRDIEHQTFTSAFLDLAVGKIVTVLPFVELPSVSNRDNDDVNNVIAELRHRLEGEHGDQLFYIYRDVGNKIVFTSSTPSRVIHAAINGPVGLSNLPVYECFQSHRGELDNRNFVEALAKLIEGKDISYQMGEHLVPSNLPKRNFVEKNPTGIFTDDDVYRVVSFFKPGVKKENVGALLEIIKTEKTDGR